MNAERPLAALRVPTLTEVVAVAEPVPHPADADTAADVATLVDAHGGTHGGTHGDTHAHTHANTHADTPSSVDLQLDDVAAPPPVGIDTAPALPTDTQLIQQVLADVSRQVELMLEYRMRETLAPILARATDTMIRDTRNQLVNTLHEMVARAVAQEMARHRDR